MIRLLAAVFVAAASLSATSTPVVQPARFSLLGAIEQGGLVPGVAPASTVRLTLGGVPVPLASDGRFIIGFDRDAPPAAILAAELADGRVLREELRVAPRAWPIEHVNVSQRPSIRSEEYRRLREAELARIASARASSAASEGWRQRPIWPSVGRISGRFGSQRIYRGQPGAYHSGVDVAAGAGAPVAAPADGVVVLAGPPAFSLEGNLVIIDHGMGVNSAFLHLSESLVRPGQTVRQGQMIGRVGATGRATGPHLHWGMKWGDARLDPARIAGPMGD